MKYSVITMGGSIVKSGMSKEKAETEKQKLCDAENLPHYYHVREDKEAEKIEASPTFEEHLDARAEASEESETEEQIVVNPLYADMSEDALNQAEKEYDNLQNEGHKDGYNPYRDNYMVKPKQPKEGVIKTLEMTQEQRNEMLIGNGLDWYLVDYDDGTTELMHSSGLSDILECGSDPEQYGIDKMEQCWNGEDLSS